MELDIEMVVPSWSRVELRQTVYFGVSFSYKWTMYLFLGESSFILFYFTNFCLKCCNYFYQFYIFYFKIRYREGQNTADDRERAKEEKHTSRRESANWRSDIPCQQGLDQTEITIETTTRKHLRQDLQHYEQQETRKHYRKFCLNCIPSWGIEPYRFMGSRSQKKNNCHRDWAYGFWFCHIWFGVITV